MSKLFSVVTATAVAAATIPAGLGVLAPGTASASTSPAARASIAAPSAYDVAWMRHNDQTDLAEIAIGKIALRRARFADTRMMAHVTIANHTVVLRKLEALAGKLDVTLPGRPSASQKAQAATLETIKGSRFDQQYDLDQVNGHLFSVYQTEGEVSRGTNASVVSFASYYLPIAERHLHMAFEDLVKILG